MTSRDLINELLSLKTCEKHAALQIFQSFPNSTIPPPQITFYIRPRQEGTILEIAREISDGNYLFEDGVQIRAFIPWDYNQLWIFLPIDSVNNIGLLCHSQNHHYLTVQNQKFVWRQAYGRQIDQNDYFQYTKKGHWVHIQSKLRLFYTIGCGGGCSHDPLKVCYDFDIVSAIQLEEEFRKRKICWGATNSNESLNCEPVSSIKPLNFLG